MNKLYEPEVLMISLGYSYNIAQDKHDKLTVNLWSYCKLIESIELKAEKFEIVEYYKSSFCTYHNVEDRKKPRVGANCVADHKQFFDQNGTLNITKKATGMIVLTIKKVLLLIVNHNRVASVNGCNSWTTDNSRRS